jgi:two-component system response regulator CpxR
MPVVLLIDDDEELCTMLTRYLGREGFDIYAVHTGGEGLKKASDGGFDIVLLDVMLPEIQGIDLLRQLRKQTQVPVLMLTARGEEVDRVVGLEVGADDYMAKPFSPRELVARMRAILRRTKATDGSTTDASSNQVVRVGDIELDQGARAVFRNSKPVELTTAEFDVLAILMGSAGRILERDSIAKAVLGRPLAPFERSIDMHISKLRRKLGNLSGGQPRIRTVRNLGYLFVNQGTAARTTKGAS